MPSFLIHVARDLRTAGGLAPHPRPIPLQRRPEAGDRCPARAVVRTSVSPHRRQRFQPPLRACSRDHPRRPLRPAVDVEYASEYSCRGAQFGHRHPASWSSPVRRDLRHLGRPAPSHHRNLKTLAITNVVDSTMARERLFLPWRPASKRRSPHQELHLPACPALSGRTLRGRPPGPHRSC